MIVLDTHTWFWWINLEHERLPSHWLPLLEGADVVGVSPVSCFEVALAARRGRMELPSTPREWLKEALGGSGVTLLPITADIAARAVDLPEIHRDPFDRVIIATALELGAALLSVDSIIPKYAAAISELKTGQAA